MYPFVVRLITAPPQGNNSRVLFVPADLNDKSALIAWYSSALGMPEQITGNWDAFDECLRNLSWIKEHKLVLYHDSVPLKSSANDQQIYLGVLADTVRDWKPGEAHEVEVVFAPDCAAQLVEIFRATTVPSRR